MNTLDRTLLVKCSHCGHENPTGPLFCESCRHLIRARGEVKSDRTHDVAVLLHSRSLQAALEENQNLRQHLESKQQELNKAKVEMANSSGVFDEIATKLKSAEERAAALARQLTELEKRKLVVLAKQIADRIREITATLQPNSRRVISGATTLIILVGFGGVGIGRYFPSFKPEDDTVRQQRNQLASKQQELASANAQLSATVTKLHSTEAEVTQARDQLIDSMKRNDQLEVAKDKEIALLREQLNKLPTSTLPRTGAVIWSGTIAGKRTIEIKDGVANYGTMSGTLPRIIFTTSPANVKLKTFPGPSNQWSHASFEVSGTGPVRVQINWELAR